MDPEYSHQGVSNTRFPPTEYDMYWVPGEREGAPSISPAAGDLP